MEVAVGDAELAPYVAALNGLVEARQLMPCQVAELRGEMNK
ncbi:hypothetical protein [Accumulibacter sp.]|nr:hypothetical protein [Accumulibacter sp.]